MSKSKLNPDEIFFGLQRTFETEAPVSEPDPVEAPATEPAGEESEPEQELEPKPAPAPAKAQPKPQPKKRGPKPNPENERKVSMNLKISPELKYSISAVVNETRYQGIDPSYNITDFVTEAIAEKLKRSKKKLGME